MGRCRCRRGLQASRVGAEVALSKRELRGTARQLGGHICGLQRRRKGERRSPHQLGQHTAATTTANTGEARSSCSLYAAYIRYMDLHMSSPYNWRGRAPEPTTAYLIMSCAQTIARWLRNKRQYAAPKPTSACLVLS